MQEKRSHWSLLNSIVVQKDLAFSDKWPACFAAAARHSGFCCRGIKFRPM